MEKNKVMDNKVIKQLKKIKQTMEATKPCNINYGSWQDKIQIRVNKNVIRRKKRII